MFCSHLPILVAFKNSCTVTYCAQILWWQKFYQFNVLYPSLTSEDWKWNLKLLCSLKDWIFNINSSEKIINVTLFSKVKHLSIYETKGKPWNTLFTKCVAANSAQNTAACCIELFMPIKLICYFLQKN